MTDNEVRQWLSKEEQWAFDRATAELGRENAAVRNPDGSIRITYVAGPWQASIAALRALAETRKALAALEWKGDCTRCPDCGVDSPMDMVTPEPSRHRAGCIFATMPRPR